VRLSSLLQSSQVEVFGDGRVVARKIKIVKTAEVEVNSLCRCGDISLKEGDRGCS
jgi:hypothetical protein